MNRKLYREIQVKNKINLTSENRIHFLVNMNSRGFLNDKLIEKRNRSLDYFTTLFIRMRLHEKNQMPRENRSYYGLITIFKDGKYFSDIDINDMPF